MTNEARAEAAEAERDLHIEEINALRKDGDDLHAQVAQLQARVAELEAQAVRDKKTVGSLGYKMGATDMRERAAELAENGGFHAWPLSINRLIAEAIRALPLDGGDGE